MMRAQPGTVTGYDPLPWLREHALDKVYKLIELGSPDEKRALLAKLTTLTGQLHAELDPASYEDLSEDPFADLDDGSSLSPAGYDALAEKYYVPSADERAAYDAELFQNAAEDYQRHGGI